MSFDGLKEKEYIGGRIFDKIEVDDRVTKDLNHCLYCRVSSTGPGEPKNRIESIAYQIPLNCINGNDFKQCPACKRIYILKDPI